MPKLPMKLDLLPGLRWAGHLTVLREHEDGYAVEFDATDAKATTERYVMDRTVLTAKQLCDWTGWKEVS